MLPNIAKKKKKNTWEGGDYCFFFFPPPWLASSSSRHGQLKQQAQRQKKKAKHSREDHVNSKVGFFKFCYLLFLANNYETVILNIETIFCKIVLLPLLLELELELETKSPFGVETETNIWYLEQHLTWVLEFLRCIALVHWLHCSRGMHFFFLFFFFVSCVYYLSLFLVIICTYCFV